jgi:glycosyltransferase involved in cell wall biosynthesis
LVDRFLPDLRWTLKNRDLEELLDGSSVILFNTIATVYLVETIHHICSVPKICWVHEGETGFSAFSATCDFSKAFKYIDKVYSQGARAEMCTDKYVDRSKSSILLFGLESLEPLDIEPHKRMRFGIFGAINARKATDKFVEAVRQMKPEIREQCEFFIVGKSDGSEYAKEVLSVAENSGITVTGELDHDDAIFVMNTMDVVVHPAFEETGPIVCIEAIQLGKGIIVSDHTGTAALENEGLQAYIYHIGVDRLSDLMEKAFIHRDELLTATKKNLEIYDRFFSMSVFEKKS